MDHISTPYYDSMIHYRNPDVPSPVITTDSSSTSDGSCSGGYEDVMLSSSYPKKRSGRKKFRETRHPVYRGIRQRGNGKWVCEVREPNGKNRIWLGTFPEADMAARAYDVAALALRGRSALLNFADSSWRLPVPASSATKDIQKAAAEAAEIFRPMEESAEVESSWEVFVEAQDENVLFEDDEVVFQLPELLTSLAEGLMVPPPHCFGYRYESDDVDYSADVSLWSF